MKKNSAGNNEVWTFLGCNWIELASGFFVFMMVKEIFFPNDPSNGMPYMLASWFFTSFTHRSIRNSIIKYREQYSGGVRKD
jgi:hypothetical protein